MKTSYSRALQPVTRSCVPYPAPRGALSSVACAFQRVSRDLAGILTEGIRLQRRLAWSLAGAALLLALGQGVATAATITVTTNNPYIISDGQCSLIEAIVNANNDAATHPDCAGRQWRRHDCLSGKRQRGAECRIWYDLRPIRRPGRSAFDCQSDHD